MDLGDAKKISIVGNSGAGKSTFSKELGKALKIEVYSIDKIYWLSGWELRDQGSFKRHHSNWLEKDSWIIEGIGYWREMEQRISKSDIVIFLDVPVELCKKRAEIRIKEEMKYPNKNITKGCVYNDVKELQIETITNFHKSLRPKLINYLSSINSDKLKIVSDPKELQYKNQTL